MDRINAAIEDVLADIQRDYDALDVDRQQGEPDAKSEKKYLKAQRNAFVKAQDAYAGGVRVRWTGRSATIPSASRPGALVHRLWRDGNVWRCTCEAHERGLLCWHVALITAYERADALADAHDDGLDSAADCGGTLPDGDDGDWASLLATAPAPEPAPAPAPLGQRLAAARARLAA